MASNNFINECTNGAYANRLGKILVDGVQQPIDETNNLSSFSIEDSCYVDGNIVGTTYLKKLSAQFLSVPTNVDLIDKRISAHVGVKYADTTEEWLNMGNYTVEHPNDEQTADLTQITAYDDFNNLDKVYVCGLATDTSHTISEYYEDVCNQLELTPKTLTFLNSDIEIEKNPFVNNETLRFVLQEIEKVACSFSEIDTETNEIDLVWLSNNENPDYEFTTEDYSILEGGMVTYGPINTLVLKYSQIDGENATKQDQESIYEYGVNELDIEDSYFLFTEELKWQAIEGIWERVKGLTYTDCKITSYYGKPFLKVGQKIRVNVNDNRVFDTYILKHTFTYDGTFKSVIESPALTKQETKTKNTSVTEAIRQTEIRVNKAEGNITATTRKVQEVQDTLNNEYYTKTNVNEIVQNAESGVTNTFSEAGGNNILRNTGLWFEDDSIKAMTYPSLETFPSLRTFTGAQTKYEFWVGNLKKGTNDNAVGYNSILLQQGTVYQEQNVPNGNYSLSFYYKKLIPRCNASVIINGVEYPLTATDEYKMFYTGEQDSETGDYIVQPIVVTNNNIKVAFRCDVDNGVEIYDLMCNKGTVKLAYSQNANETITDTVNISKGITITSTDTDTVFKANADGIRLLDKNKNVKTRFTDKGMTTKEQIVEDKAQICGTLVLQVGDQTWFTRM